MSILSSTGTGYDLGHFNDLYKRKDDLYKEIRENSAFPAEWRPQLSNVYNEDEFSFIYDYIQNHKWDKDKQFVDTIKKLYSLWSLYKGLQEEITKHINNEILNRIKTEYEHEKMLKNFSRQQISEYKKHGNRKSAYII